MDRSMSLPAATIDEDIRPPRGSGRPLHVAHLMTTFQIGGLERLVYALARRTAEMGVRTTVLAYGEDGELRGAFERAGIPAIFVPTDGGIQYRLGPRIAFELSARRIQLLHSHHLGPFFYGAIAASLAGIPHVTTEHSRELYDTKRRRLLGRSMPHASQVVTVSRELAEWRRAEFGDDPVVIFNGVEVPPTVSEQTRIIRRRELGLRGSFVVGCVARFSPEKDHLTLVRAFRRLVDQRPDAELVLVGWGPEEDAITAEVTALGLGENVVNLGRRDDVEQVVEAFHIMSLTSVREGLPLALLEGMAAGLPIVATDVGDVGRLVENEEGRVCAAGDVEGLGDAMIAYASDERAVRRSGARARSLVQRSYSLESTAREYVRVYDALVHPSPRSSVDMDFMRATASVNSARRRTATVRSE